MTRPPRHPDTKRRDDTERPKQPVKAALARHDDLHAIGHGFLATNEFIRRGYRVHHTATDCVRSLFQLHNETWNVWTHVVGTLLFATLVVLPIDETPTVEPADDALATWPVRVYLLSAALCFALSVTYHLLYVQTRKLAAVLLQVDLGGVVVLLIGSTVPVMCYTFLCDPLYQHLFVALDVAICGGGFAATFTRKFRSSPGLRVALLLGVVGAMCVLPLGRLLCTVGGGDPLVTLMLQPMAMAVVAAVPGFVFYASRIPERLAPGQFDIWGSSHQLWHVFVLLAALAYYDRVGDLFEYRQRVGCAVDGRLH